MGILILSEDNNHGTLFYPPIYKTTQIKLNPNNTIKTESSENDQNSLATIIPDGDNFFITSKKDTLVNNRKINGIFKKKTQLNDNDEIKIGNRILKVKIEYGLGSNPREVFELICYENNFPNLIVIDNQWLQFDRENIHEFNQLAANEELASEDIRKNRPFTEKEKLRDFFKIYLSFSHNKIFVAFDMVLKAINESKIPLISGKVGITSEIYTRSKHIVLYVIGKNNKDKLLSKLKSLRFPPNFQKCNSGFIEHCKTENNFICWNQGGHSIRNAAKEVQKFPDYFTGENYHLIEPKKLM